MVNQSIPKEVARQDYDEGVLKLYKLPDGRYFLHAFVANENRSLNSTPEHFDLNVDDFSGLLRKAVTMIEQPRRQDPQVYQYSHGNGSRELYVKAWLDNDAQIVEQRMKHFSIVTATCVIATALVSVYANSSMLAMNACLTLAGGFFLVGSAAILTSAYMNRQEVSKIKETLRQSNNS